MHPVEIVGTLLRIFIGARETLKVRAHAGTYTQPSNRGITIDDKLAG